MDEFEQLVKLLDLYPHNITIAHKIGEAYDSGETRVSVIQDTGTGKTYLGLYVGAKFKNKKMRWLVPYNSIKEHVETTIFSNPNISNLFNQIDWQIITYSSLINMTEEELAEFECELLIVDELHHVGAPVWGERVRTIVDTHPHITLFGMSAYKVRGRGTVYERDVTNPDTDEIFSGTVVSEYDRYDAIIDGVLAKPIVKTVITEDCDEINEIKRHIEMLKKKNDPQCIGYQKMLDDVIAMIHQQDGIKRLVQQTVYPGGKYYYFCPVNSVEGKNDMDTIMSTIMGYIREKYPNERIVFYKTTSADGDMGKKNRDCFYRDVDLEGKDASNAIRIMFAKNQYNEGVHAPGVNAEFLGRKTRSDMVAGELSGRVLSARGDIYKKVIEYEQYDVRELIKLAEERGLTIKSGASKQHIIEILIAPVIIDLADNISYFQEMETNLGYRIEERRNGSIGEQRQFEVGDPKISIEVTNKHILDILQRMRDKLRQKTWDDWYALAKAYYDQHKNSDIPIRFKTINGYDYDENGFNLGKWCSRQRTNCDALSQERRSKLMAIEFRFETIERMSWDDWYKLVEAYFNHNGHSRVPSTFKTINGYDYDERGVSPGKWCSSQRHAKDSLTENQLAKLATINFSFELQKTWDDWYALAKAYYDHHKNSDIPKNFKTKNGYEYDAEGVGLGEWCKSQRSEKCTLTPEQITKLQAINFRFLTRTFIPWETYYTLAAAHFQKWGHLKITASFMTSNGYEYDANGIPLGRWLISQRGIAKKGGLKPKQREKLETIGFDFETMIEMTWDDWYALLEKYHKNKGHSDVPTMFKTINGYEYDEEGHALGNWCNNQRQHPERLNPEKRAKLDALNFRMESKKEIQWNQMYDLAKNYFDFYGHSEIPGTFKTTNGIEFDSGGKALGSWISEQRRARKKTTPERKNKLDLIGFRFCVMEEHQEKIRALCNEYGLDMEKYKILSVISYQELLAKINFLLANNMELQVNGELHPIFSMSDKDMKNQYGISKEEIITSFYLKMKRSG